MMRKLFLLITLVLCALTAKAELQPYPTFEKDGKLYYQYPVPKSIGLYRISVNFGVRQEEIVAANPQIRTRGLQLGEVIFIPVREEDITPVEPEAAPAVADAPVEQVEEEQPVADDLAPEEGMVVDQDPTPAAARPVEHKKLNQALHIALLLPLQADVQERTAQMDRFVDFYEGALLAVYDVQAAGQQIHLKVIDTNRSTARIEQLISDDELDGMDAIIGPAYPAQVEMLSAYVARKQIPTLVPFTDRITTIDTNPYLLQFNVPGADEARMMAQYLAADTLVNCVFVEADEQDIPESILALRHTLQDMNASISMTTVHQILVDSIAEALVPGRENVLILNTEKFANISVLMPHLVFTDGNLLSLYSQYSWQKERILLPQIYTTEFATELPADLTHYNDLYQRYFAHEHAGVDPRYDLLGYDLVRVMLARLMGVEYQGLQSDVTFERVCDAGGYINRNVRVIRK